MYFIPTQLKKPKISETFEDEDSVGNIFKGTKISFADSLSQVSS